MTDSGHPQGLRVALWGAFVNGVLALIKLITGVVGHSYALVADAVESMADIAGSLVVWSGIRVAHRPPDEDHPYGHGKAEPLAALVVSVMLVGAALGIAIEAVREIRTPHHSPAAYTLWVLLGVIATKEILYRIGRTIARRSGSTAVLADAWHHRSDAITSLAAAIGISVALIGGERYAPADDWAALFASTVILFNAVRIARAPVGELMDVHPAEVTTRVREVARDVEGVAAVEKILARKHGRRYLVDMHVEVDPELSVREAHRIAHDVKDAVRVRLPDVLDVLVHIEPEGGVRNAEQAPVRSPRDTRKPDQPRTN